MSGRVTLLAGGNTVYVYPDINTDREGLTTRIAVQRMLLDVAYPADDTLVRTMTAEAWPAARDALIAEGVEIVDTRAPAGTTP